jgi:hypothetical protein
MSDVARSESYLTLGTAVCWAQRDSATPGSLDGVANITRKGLGGNPECA